MPGEASELLSLLKPVRLLSLVSVRGRGQVSQVMAACSTISRMRSA